MYLQGPRNGGVWCAFSDCQAHQLHEEISDHDHETNNSTTRTDVVRHIWNGAHVQKCGDTEISEICDTGQIDSGFKNG